MTSRPNSSIDPTTTSVGSVLVVGLKVSWSKPMSTQLCTERAHSFPIAVISAEFSAPGFGVHEA